MDEIHEAVISPIPRLRTSGIATVADARWVFDVSRVLTLNNFFSFVSVVNPDRSFSFWIRATAEDSTNIGLFVYVLPGVGQPRPTNPAIYLAFSLWTNILYKMN